VHPVPEWSNSGPFRAKIFFWLTPGYPWAKLSCPFGAQTFGIRRDTKCHSGSRNLSNGTFPRYPQEKIPDPPDWRYSWDPRSRESILKKISYLRRSCFLRKKTRDDKENRVDDIKRQNDRHSRPSGLASLYNVRVSRWLSLLFHRSECESLPRPHRRIPFHHRSCRFWQPLRLRWLRSPPCCRRALPQF
jgi:hypothetical protein